MPAVSCDRSACSLFNQERSLCLSLHSKTNEKAHRFRTDEEHDERERWFTRIQSLLSLISFEIGVPFLFFFVHSAKNRALSRVDMARPQHDAVAPAANVPSRSRAARVVAAAATVMFACAAVVALVGVSTQTPKSSVMAQTTVATPKASVTMLAEYFLKHGSTMTDKVMGAFGA